MVVEAGGMADATLGLRPLSLHFRDTTVGKLELQYMGTLDRALFICLK